MSKERPILFSSDMVRAVLDGRKTQTRRIAKSLNGSYIFHDDGTRQWDGKKWRSCPYGVVGDRLYVKEGYQIEQYTFRRNCVGGKYLADNKKFWTEIYQREYDLIKNRKYPLRATSGRFMYKSLARIWLEITSIRVERVQDIGMRDCIAEGIEPLRKSVEQLRSDFWKLWDSLNAKRGYSWDSNCWVWVIEFRRTEL